MSFLGVDLGITNIATDSTGQIYRRSPEIEDKRRKLFSAIITGNSTLRPVLDELERESILDCARKIAEKAAMFGCSVALERLHIPIWNHGAISGAITNECDRLNVKVVFVFPAYTSMTCNICMHCQHENRNAEEFLCNLCGHSDHADINAAKNIAKRAIGTFKPKITNRLRKIDEKSRLNLIATGEPESTIERCFRFAEKNLIITQAIRMAMAAMPQIYFNESSISAPSIVCTYLERFGFVFIMARDAYMATYAAPYTDIFYRPYIGMDGRIKSKRYRISQYLSEESRIRSLIFDRSKSSKEKTKILKKIVQKPSS